MRALHNAYEPRSAAGRLATRYSARAMLDILNRNQRWAGTSSKLRCHNIAIVALEVAKGHREQRHAR
jgi:hypothetical protein